jgi:nucleoid-associated protein YgaU
MTDRRSRYRNTPVLGVDDGHGEAVRLLDLRQTPPTTGVLSVVPTESDRLDLLAWRFYRDPTRFWRICDAATELDPFDLLWPGEPLVIPTDK